ncbi:hypothetical protein SD70_04425 [Gordoniibacillus kamchatkensis]|uniref:Spore germination protein n=1 Tax=Gordoniibacillus kamchatkensis TaxID=1590651 RepID=A0ABR5ALH1_9BACL|nr:GerAB/ArcD/ProY family transporter [Paenibacillus sp. VKM B-2647]KIL41866.1 hypothetical protein SD70_04425 [Paenibacillus sp. VKM B-2647]
MNRYFYYMVLNNMLVNVLALVPRILIRERFDGAVMALFWAAAIGTAFMYAFTKSIEKFPRQGLPEILGCIMPVWLKSCILVGYLFVWQSAGIITMLYFADLTRQFINPDIPNLVLICLYSVIVVWIAQFPSIKVLYLLEMIIVLCVPLIAFILFKSFFNKGMQWDGVFAVAMFYDKWPTWSAVAAATYIFTGYTNMAVFNRVFPNFRPKLLWLGGLLGFAIELTTMFLPIGMLGADAVGRYVFAWMSTADSMRIELGFIERVMYIFIFFIRRTCVCQHDFALARRYGIDEKSGSDRAAANALSRLGTVGLRHPLCHGSSCGSQLD